jgi:hypothetical protein
MSRETLERFYTAFGNLDAATMQSCYAESARFEDPIFKLAGARQIGGMWRMLCGELRLRGIGQWKLEVEEMRARGEQGRVRWQARYPFGDAGRVVRNRVYSRFDFDDKGLIARQRDAFSFWNWSRQAIGVPGLLFGWTPTLHARVQLKAGQQLARYMEKNR